MLRNNEKFDQGDVSANPEEVLSYNNSIRQKQEDESKNMNMSSAKRDRDRSSALALERRPKTKTTENLKRMRTHDTGLDNSLNETYSKRKTSSKPKNNQAEETKDPFEGFYREEPKKVQTSKINTKLNLNDL
jgi:hypothetical protein